MSTDVTTDGIAADNPLGISPEYPPPEQVAAIQQTIAAGRQVTGMQQVYDEIDERVGVPDVKARMLRRRLGPRPYEVDGLGTVMIRPLSQDEIKGLKEEASGDDRRFEHLLVATALTEPVMAEHEVAVWTASAPAGEVVEVMGYVQQASRLDRGSAKSSVPAVRG